MNESTPKTLKCIEKWLNDNNGGDGFFVGSSVSSQIKIYKNVQILRYEKKVKKYKQ